MSRMSIRGSEYAIKKIFSDDFVFTIPLYQRAYSWTTEEAEELLQDLVRSIEGQGENVDEIAPYFLGSIVLIKDEEQPDAQVVDGQQRLTTLTMLLSALRCFIDADYVEGLTAFLCEKGNVVTGTPTRYRLTLRKQDADFFKQYIQDEHGIEKLKTLTFEGITPDSKRNIRDNTLCFLKELSCWMPDKIIKLTQFLVNRCFLIVVAVSTPDLDSAYRIFSVLNNRGLNLSYPDILKAEFISNIPLEQQEVYSGKWDDLAGLLGSENFEDLFSSLRSIFARKRSSRGFIEEFHEYVYYPGHNKNMAVTQFIDDVLVSYAYAFNNIISANYQHRTLEKTLAKDINTMFKLLNRLDYQRWIPPVLYYFYTHWREPERVLRFLQDMERLVVSFIVCRVPPYRRIDRYCQILESIYQEKDLFASRSPLQLTPSECVATLNKLDGDMYLFHHICRYVLLRLDAHLSEGVAQYDYDTVSIEHVLPQRPAPESSWLKTFPSGKIRQQYVHRLGNLALLSRSKNSRAENFEFEYKKNQYFCSSGGISPFVLTTEVLQYRDWTPSVIEQRQAKLVGTLKKLWRL